MQCVFLTADMMFSSRVMGAASAAGVPLKIVATAADLPKHVGDQCRLALIDLMMSGLNLLEAVGTIREQAPQARIVAFGPHVDEQLLAGASQAGCEVVTRGQFQQQHTALLQSISSTGV